MFGFQWLCINVKSCVNAMRSIYHIRSILIYQEKIDWVRAAKKEVKLTIFEFRKMNIVLFFTSWNKTWPCDWWKVQRFKIEQKIINNLMKYNYMLWRVLKGKNHKKREKFQQNWWKIKFFWSDWIESPSI